MANLTPEQLQKQLDEVSAQLAAANSAKAKAEADAAEAKAKLEKSGVRASIKGSYKGYSFADGHRRIRDRMGRLCDTQEVMNAANNPNDEKHAEACAILDWYIDSQYAYLVKAKSGK